MNVVENLMVPYLLKQISLMGKQIGKLEEQFDIHNNKLILMNQILII